MGKLFLTLLAAGSMQILLAAPSWYLEVKSDTESAYYGYGSGETKEEAIKNALSDVASKIAVTIESSFSSVQSVSGEIVEKEQRNQVLSNVKKMNFNNYEALKTAKEDETLYALVRVDREQLLEDKKGELDLLSSKLTNELSSLEGVSEIEKFKILNDTAAEFQTMLDTSTVGKSIVSTFDPSPYVTLYSRYKKLLSDTRSRIVLSIVAENDTAKHYTKTFAAYLSKQGIKISPTRSNATLVLSADAKQKKVISTNEAIQNAIFASITLSTTLKNGMGTEIASNTLTFSNNSNSSFSDALKKTQKLEKFLSENPDKVLNFILAIQTQGE